jgi:3-hydroxyisobutyrate dehydrogenase-like beta-hydroxyacid dehydrogenase
MPPLPKIGFVGVGRMGANLARRLKDCAELTFKERRG